MKKTINTPEGKIKRDLTPEEVDLLAQAGDIEAKKEIAKEDLSKASTVGQRVEAIEKYLGLKDA